MRPSAAEIHCRKLVLMMREKALPQSEREKEKVKLKLNMKEVDVSVLFPILPPSQSKEDGVDGGESYCLLGAHASSLQREKGNAFFM